MKKYSLQEIQNVFKRKGYVTFTKPYDLNIFGIRSENSQSDKFDDWLGFWCTENSKTTFYIFPATTDPGKHWLLTPMRKEGTAIMVPGQYKGLYKKGFHKTYPALEQKGLARYVRDNNKDIILDFDLYRDPLKASKHVFLDNIKSNIHKAGFFSNLVGKYSAACQVTQKSADFDLLMSYVDKQITAGLGNSFTYTLIEERDF